MAIGRRPSSPSDSVKTEISTSPLSLPTFVHQEALPAAVPCNFLHTFFVESIFKTLPKIAVQVARSCGSLLRMSLAYTDINQLPGKTFKYITANTSIKHSYRALGTPANGTGSAATGRASANRSSTIPWLRKQKENQ